MDVTSLVLAKKYTDEQVAKIGGSPAGDGLPVVKITEVNSDGVIVSAEETAQLAKALESDVAFVVATANGYPRVFSCARMTTEEEGTFFIGSACYGVEATESPGSYLSVVASAIFGVMDGVGMVVSF